MAADGALLGAVPDNFRGIFNLPGVPAISIPCGFDDRALPVGIQIVGPRLGESPVLAAGHAFQSATDWHRRRPPLDVLRGYGNRSKASLKFDRASSSGRLMP